MQACESTPPGTRALFTRVKDHHGFTLIELIVSLVLMGVIASIGGLGIIEGLEAYFMSRENITGNQKVQLAMNRITLELQRMENIVSGGADNLTFTSVSRPNGERCTIQLADGGITLRVEPAAQASILVEHVTNGNLFEFTRIDGTAWTPGSALIDLDRIRVSITVKRTDLMDTGEQAYLTYVTPRNNGLPNGPAPNPKPLT